MKSSDLVSRLTKVCSGNIGIAAVSFLISVTLFKLYGSNAFGSFSLFLIFSSFHFSIASSLFFVPASRMEFRYDKDSFIEKSSIFFIITTIVFGFIFYLFLHASESNESDIFSYVVMFLFASIRNYIRSYSFVISETDKSVKSDLILFLLSVFVLIPFAFTLKFSLSTFCFIFSFFNVLSLSAFGWSYIIKFMRVNFDLLSYKNSYREQLNESKHSCIGVIYTEIVSNFHSYFIPLIHGVKSYAIVAMCFMIFRPFAIGVNSIIQSERVHLIETDKLGSNIKKPIIKLTTICLIGFALNFVLGFIFLICYKDLFNSKLELVILLVCGSVILMRSVKSIVSLGLQVKGFFKMVNTITSKYLIVIPLLGFISYFSTHHFVMLYFTLIVEMLMLYEFYKKFKEQI